MGKVIYWVLVWIDNNINHTIIGRIFDLFPVEHEDGSVTLSYKIWKHTSRAFCLWVIEDLGDKYNPPKEG